MAVYTNCADCGKRLDVLAPSVNDPRRCIRCAPMYFAWWQTPIGKFRRVPPALARRWEPR